MDEKKMTVTQLVAILLDFADHHESIQDEYQRRMEEADNSNDVPNPYDVAAAAAQVNNNKNSNQNGDKKTNLHKSGGAATINVDETDDDSNETVAYDETEDE